MFNFVWMGHPLHKTYKHMTNNGKIFHDLNFCLPPGDEKFLMAKPSWCLHDKNGFIVLLMHYPMHGHRS